MVIPDSCGPLLVRVVTGAARFAVARYAEHGGELGD
jgi:hypothetical protein